MYSVEVDILGENIRQKLTKLWFKNPQTISLKRSFLPYIFFTGVGDNINTMKTTFDLNFDLYQAVKQLQIHINIESREAVNLKSLSMTTCKLVI